MNDLNRKKIELLAPCGGEESFIAAVENGADAVYVGGQSFNARAHAKNFDRDTMRRAIAYAHRHGVQVHVTMNTLLRDEELPGALEYAEFLYAAGADALIVQDLGLVSLLRRTMPDFPLHYSTQGTVSDLASLRAVEDFGFSRVVLSREVSLPEIREMAGKTGMELEVFLHGALCFCYSGQCQLSRYYGGRSGNRGECAQPCRLRWNTRTEVGKPVQTVPYPLSMKDLCLLPDLPDLIEAGVSSLKIEGRMKSPEYVATVVSIYRKYIDQYYETGSISVKEKDLDALYQIFNRGKFTDGYAHGEQGMDLISGEVPKNQGIRIGTFVGRPNRGRGKEETLADVKLYGDLAIGDGVEIRETNPKGDRPRIAGNVISYRKPAGNGRIRIGDIRGELRPGDTVYRTSSKAQLDAVRRSFRGKSFDAAEESAKWPVAVYVHAEGGRLVATAIAGDVTAVREAGPFEKAEAGADTRLAEKLREAFAKAGNTPFELELYDFSGEDDLRVKRSEMNALRRELYAELDAAMAAAAAGRKERADGAACGAAGAACGIERADGAACGTAGAGTVGGAGRTGSARPAPAYDRDALPEKLAGCGDCEKSPVYPEIVYYRYEDLAVDCGLRPELAGEGAVLLPAAEMLVHEEELAALQGSLAGNLRLIPYIPSVVRGAEQEVLSQERARLVALSKETGIYCGNIGWARDLLAAGVEVHAGNGLNVYNYECEKALSARGILPGVRATEALEKEAGAYPLMVSEHRPAGDILAAGPKKLRILNRSTSRQTVLIPDTGAMFYLRKSCWNGIPKKNL